jgi:hypothetical protein
MHGPTRSALLRLLVSAAVGVAMAGTTFVSAYRMTRNVTTYEDLTQGSVSEHRTD